VAKVVQQAAYMVLGLGDVYLGAPCAVPVDPRCATPPPPVSA
jgi:allophanate hydrolase subunit 1